MVSKHTKDEERLDSLDVEEPMEGIDNALTDGMDSQLSGVEDNQEDGFWNWDDAEESGGEGVDFLDMEALMGGIDDTASDSLDSLASGVEDSNWDDDLWHWDDDGESGEDTWSGAVDEDAPEIDGDLDSQGVTPAVTDEMTIELMKALVTVMELGVRRELPDTLKEQIEQLAGGDSSVNAAQVALQLVEFAPRPIAANLDSVSFSEGRSATGRRFSVAIPDSWIVLGDDLEQPDLPSSFDEFVACPGKPQTVADVALCDRIVYINDKAIAGSESQYSQLRLECGTDEFNWALRWHNAYCPSNNSFAESTRHAIWDAEVDSVNTKSLVVQLESSSGAIFQIWPYANDHSDCLLLVLGRQNADASETAREFAVRIARSIKLDQPILPTCLVNLDKAIEGKVDAVLFESIVESLSQPFVVFRQPVFDAAQRKYTYEAAWLFDATECTLAGARGIARLSHRSIPYLEKLLDAYDTQVRCGASLSERSKIISFVGAFEGNSIPSYGIFSEEDALIVKDAGIFNPSPALESLRARLDSARYHLRETPNEATLSTADSPYCQADSSGMPKVGDVFELGTYHYDENGAYRPLEWRILKIKGTHALAISTECIELQHYNEFDGPVSWETSTIREWLNNSFAKAVFTAEDRKRVSGARIANPSNDTFGTDGGNSTKDRLFLLSIEEAETLFDSDEDRKASPSPYAESLGANQWWWLRSPGHKDTHAAYVGGDGSINMGGSKACLIARSVRPAFYLKLNRED